MGIIQGPSRKKNVGTFMRVFGTKNRELVSSDRSTEWDIVFTTHSSLDRSSPRPGQSTNDRYIGHRSVKKLDPIFI